MKSKALLFWLALLLVVGGGAIVYAAWVSYSGQPRVGGLSHSPADGGPTDEPAASPAAGEEWLTDFLLTERSGRPFSSKSLRGKVWVASFFFASCPQFCWQQNLAVSDVQRQFGPRGVVFVSITCNPAQDTPAVLSAYADRLGADKEQWLFLTGELPYIRRVGAEVFQVPVDMATHNDKLILMDRQGKVIDYYSSTSPEKVKELSAKLEELLAEGQGE
jgi:protein SCO1/2